jgi:hypothetical protein
MEGIQGTNGFDFGSKHIFSQWVKELWQQFHRDSKSKENVCSYVM